VSAIFILSDPRFFFVDRRVAWYSPADYEKLRGCKSSTQEGNQRKVEANLDFEKVARVKKLALKALFSDPELGRILVLKGGSAIDLAFAYPSGRSSIDIDLSIPQDFIGDLGAMNERMQTLLKASFRKQGYMVIDCFLKPRPSKRHPDLPEFWKGYLLNFKLVSMKNHEAHKDDLEKLRRLAEIVGPGSTVKIEISAFEYCEEKIPVNIGGSEVYVYSPEMIVAEKLRAICQQMPEYPYIGKRAKRPRARDFYDIHNIVEHESGIYWPGETFMETVKKTFGAKGVNTALLAKIQDESVRIFHEPDFEAVKATVSVEVAERLMNFGFYFDSIAQFVLWSKPLWKK
jgi:predicted nucleotidyltransferase component of viral defense system